MPSDLKWKRFGITTVIIIVQLWFCFNIMFNMYKKTQTANDILPTPETCDRNIRLHSMHGKPQIFIKYAEKDYENFMNSMGDNYGSRNLIYQA